MNIHDFVAPFPSLSHTIKQTIPVPSSLIIQKIIIVTTFIFTGIVLGIAYSIGRQLSHVRPLMIGSIAGLITGLIISTLLKDKRPTRHLPLPPPIPIPIQLRTPQKKLSLNRVSPSPKRIRNKEQKIHFADLAQRLEERIQRSESNPISVQEIESTSLIASKIRNDMIKQQNFQILYQHLVEKFGQPKTDEVFFQEDVLTEYFNDPHFQLSELKMTFISKKIERFFHNKTKLQSFRKRISEITGSFDLFDRIFNSPQMKELNSGDSLFTEEVESTFLQYIQNENGDKFENLLKTISELAKTGICLDEDFLEDRFEISKIFEGLSTEEKQIKREQLQRTINQAYIQRELKQKIRLSISEKDEPLLLSYLGYPIDDLSPYHQKDLICENVQTLVSEEIEINLHQKSLNSVREQLKECALKARLATIEIKDSLLIKKFQFAYQRLKEIRKKFNDCQIPLIFPQNFPLRHDSIIARSLNQTFSLVRENFTHHSIGNFFETIELKKYFRDNSSLIEFETFLLEQEKRIDYHSFSQSLRKIQQTPANLQEIQFYQRWGKHIRVQMVQGLEDANQILGEGICWGLCQRICLEGADYPHISPEEFAKKITITQKDRFLQSIHSYGTRSNIPESFLLPEQVLQREGIDSDSTIFELNWDKEQNVLKGWLESNFEQLGESFGWFRLSLKMETALQQSLGHVICIRFDTLNHCYWLVDPNIGFLTFEGANLPPRTAQENALSFFKELIQYYYSSTTQIHGTQHRR